MTRIGDGPPRRDANPGASGVELEGYHRVPTPLRPRMEWSVDEDRVEQSRSRPAVPRETVAARAPFATRARGALFERPLRRVKLIDEAGADPRAVVTPRTAASLLASGLEVFVERSRDRAFADDEYARAGARLIAPGTAVDADVILTTKEPALARMDEELRAAWFAFYHSWKQPTEHRRRLIESKRRLSLDYELLEVDGKRVVKFGGFAGMSGMYAGLVAAARIYGEEALAGLPDPRQAHDVSALRRHLDAVDVSRLQRPLVVGVMGSGAVSNGGLEILRTLSGSRHYHRISPAELRGSLSPGLYEVNFGRGDRYELDGAGPNRRSAMPRYLDRVDLLLNGTYWDRSIPRLVTARHLNRLERDRPLILLDVTCDPGGSIQITEDTADFNRGFQLWDGAAGKTRAFVSLEQLGPEIGDGTVVNLVHNRLPGVGAFARDASELFASKLAPLLEVLAQTRNSPEWRQALEGAVLTVDGELNPRFAQK